MYIIGYYMALGLRRGSLAIRPITLSPRQRVDNILVDLTPEFLLEGRARGISSPDDLKIFVDRRLEQAEKAATDMVEHGRSSLRPEST